MFYIMQVLALTQYYIIQEFNFLFIRATMNKTNWKIVGSDIKKVPCTTVSDYMDELCWGSTVSCVHCDYAT